MLLVSLGGNHSSLRWVGSERIDLMDVAHCYCWSTRRKSLRAKGSVFWTCIMHLVGIRVMQPGIGTQMTWCDVGSSYQLSSIMGMWGPLVYQKSVIRSDQCPWMSWEESSIYQRNHAIATSVRRTKHQLLTVYWQIMHHLEYGILPVCLTLQVGDAETISDLEMLNPHRRETICRLVARTLCPDLVRMQVRRVTKTGAPRPWIIFTLAQRMNLAL